MRKPLNWINYESIEQMRQPWLNVRSPASKALLDFCEYRVTRNPYFGMFQVYWFVGYRDQETELCIGEAKTLDEGRQLANNHYLALDFLPEFTWSEDPREIGTLIEGRSPPFTVDDYSRSHITCYQAKALSWDWYYEIEQNTTNGLYDAICYMGNFPKILVGSFNKLSDAKALAYKHYADIMSDTMSK